LNKKIKKNFQKRDFLRISEKLNLKKSKIHHFLYIFLFFLSDLMFAGLFKYNDLMFDITGSEMIIALYARISF